MTQRKSREKKPKENEEVTPQVPEENPSVQITPEQAKEVEYKEDEAPSVTETRFAEENPVKEETPEGDVVKDGVVVSTKHSRREEERKEGGE